MQTRITAVLSPSRLIFDWHIFPLRLFFLLLPLLSLHLFSFEFQFFPLFSFHRFDRISFFIRRNGYASDQRERFGSRMKNARHDLSRLTHTENVIAETTKTTKTTKIRIKEIHLTFLECRAARLRITEELISFRSLFAFACCRISLCFHISFFSCSHFTCAPIKSQSIC